MFNTKAKGKAGPSVLKHLRAEYLETWSRDWPHDDDYLSELWFEEKVNAGASETQKTGPSIKVAYSETLVRMRENHDFDEDAKSAY